MLEWPATLQLLGWKNYCYDNGDKMNFLQKPSGYLTAGLVSLLLIWFANGSLAESTGSRESGYSVYAKGLKVGELKTVCAAEFSGGRKLVKFHSDMRINANFIVYSYALATTEEAIVGDGGTLSYRRTTRENDKLRQVDGRFENDGFQLEIKENGSSHALVIARNAYDFTTMECPEIRLKKEGEEIALRLLDLETLSVVTRRYKWVRSEDLVVDGKKFRCRVIDFEDVNKTCRRWIAEDELGVIIARQDGKGKAGSYSLRMQSLTLKPARCAAPAKDGKILFV